MDLVEPANHIFDAIEDLAEIGEISHKPYLDHHLVDIGFIIINKNRASRQNIGDWLHKPEHKQTWASLKTPLPC